ncbi:MAG: NAD(P)-binding protein, partial [[Bacteroides] pectinophilus]|nr:NAD(P)-binding protein [[Bacteroides] pectinophilus]
MKKYDILLVGGGLYNGVIAYYAAKAGKKCLVVEKREHLGGNIYCEDMEGIHVHKYGAHIFHTSNKEVWDFVNA